MAACGEPAGGVLPPCIQRQGPASFPDLAKVPRDLLMKGFCPGHVLSFSCLGPKSIVLKSMATIRTDSTVGVATASLMEGCSKYGLAFSTLNKQITGITLFSDIAIPGLTAILQASAPRGRKYAKITLQYVNEIANVSAKVCGTQSHPEVKLSLGVGSSCMSVCGITLLDSHTKRVISARAGIGYQNESRSAAVLYDPLAGRCVDTYVSHVLSPELHVAAHFCHQIDQRCGL